jgi:predicted ester cyclase
LRRSRAILSTPKGDLMSITLSKPTLPGVGSPLRQAPVTNMERMYALDEAWNARDWDTFDAYHDQDEVVVYWPGREDAPTRGGHDHRAESVRFAQAFPDNRVKHPYDVLFGDGDYTAFVTSFTGTFTGPLELPDGTVIEPTGKAFEVVFSTIARWRDGKIVEEYLMYDNGEFMEQIGLA